QEALAFVHGLIDAAGELGAPAIIGSMQGRHGPDATEARKRLAEALEQLGDRAAHHGQPLLYEPLNRYETNMANTLAQGVELLELAGNPNVLLLADLFHMGIEEDDSAAALRAAGPRVGHVHFVDSNRKPAGFGQMAYAPIADALRAIGYDRYLSAEAFPFPDPERAAARTIETFRRHFPR
ncbi:MAG: sugar phosphate isomerase/epimerase, partial [Gemmataceae bacterium]|nr:sugar phosphate isomerase/epimerase [Gemmataceae bacterium]